MQPAPTFCFRGFFTSARGAGHRRDNRPCQDASGIRLARDYAALAVADGHGGEKYVRSDVGSRVAVDAALEVLVEFLRDYGRNLPDLSDKKAEAMQRHLAGRIIARWRERVERHFTDNPPDAAELARLARQGVAGREFQAFFYGTTLLYGAMTAHRCFLSQIGDGRAVTLDATGGADFPVPEDERLGCGLTTSLCDERAIEHFRHCFLSMPRTIFLATDGLSDSYTSKSLGRFTEVLAARHAQAPNRTERQTREWLPRLSEQGSHDDVSLALIYAIAPPPCPDAALHARRRRKRRCLHMRRRRR